MGRTLYGLLVAIDRYKPPVPPLSGCVSDIDDVNEMLRGLYSGVELSINLAILKNEAATRSAVIQGFRDHLSKAGPDDVAFFYYCGHGSQEDAPPEFWHLEPDRLDETLVCYDSRDPGGWDIADKELSILISEVASRNPQIVCILDCCHSGSGTRAALEDGIAVRRAPTDRRPRGVDTFLDGALKAASDSRIGDLGTGWWLPSGKHVLLAACRPSETAKEIRENGSAHGAFTVSLLAALRESRGAITYRDLMKRAEAQVRLRVPQQVPQAEASDPMDLQRAFLGGPGRSERANFTLRNDGTLGWVVDGGAVHGIVRPLGAETTILAIFDIRDPIDRKLEDALATAEVEKVLPELSCVRLQGQTKELDRSSTYRAVVISAPLPTTCVFLSGHPDAIGRLREAIERTGVDGRPSTLIREVERETDAAFRIDGVNSSFRISRAEADRPLVAEIVGLNESGAKAAVERLEHIARWRTVAGLENPISSLAAQSIEITILVPVGAESSAPWQEVDAGQSIQLEYQYNSGRWRQPRMRIGLKNKSQMDVYAALLWLGEDYSVSSELIPGGTVYLRRGESVILNNGQPIWGHVPDDKWREGRTEVHDLLKLIVSTEQFDATLMDQAKIDSYVVTRGLKAQIPKNALERQAARIHDRGLSTAPNDEESTSQWTVRALSVSVVRPLEAVDVPPLGQNAGMGAGITLVGHPSLRATASLMSPTAAGRGLGEFMTPAILRDSPADSQPFLFETPRGTDSGLGILQLTDIRHAEAVTAEQPLILRVPARIEPGEHILPYAWDGEFFLPLGIGRATGEGTEIQLYQIPEPLQTKRDLERGIVSSVRILFQKFLSSRLGTEYDYPRLAVVTFDDRGAAIYETQTNRVRHLVGHANRILLYVHGILGDTLGMTRSSQTEIASLNALPNRIADHYDLVMAFDYENINTGIRETARELGERLASVGLGPGHSKHLHIAAHSMGGLVSRWFIEREDGNRVVEHLVTLGTPHAGSPWPKIQDWATAALGLGLNGLTATAWPAHVLSSILPAIESVDVMLDEMAPDSPLVRELSQSEDPGIAYTLLVGNTSIIPAAVTNGILERLLAKLSPQRLLHAATGLAFFHSPNDIAVSVASAKAIPNTRRREAIVSEVACDHVSFFTSTEGQRALLNALKKH
jgi:pimeloyl-ACP methyl ester carboxylesterase